MHNYHHILMTTEEQQAVERIEQIKDSQCKLSLLHPVQAYGSGMAYVLPSLTRLDEERMASARSSLATVGKKLGVDESNQSVTMGRIADVIIGKANELKVDLIVVDNKNERYMLGSTVNALMGKVSCDILVVRT